MIIPVILAGGSGTRLWPLSRKHYPKQLIELVDENSMIQDTVLRLSGYRDMEQPVIICNDEYRFMIAEHMRKINVDPALIILEPVGKNTAAAIAVASLMIQAKYDDPVLLVLPADHQIENVASFHEILELGNSAAKMGNLVTFGIVPKEPETGYGYIKKTDSVSDFTNVFHIDKFIEKPNLKNAKKYVESGEYCWNSGMFMFKASTILQEFKKYAPDIVKICQKAVAAGKEDLDFFRLDKENFEKSPSDSIDYKIMEKTLKGVLIPCDIGWSDIGSFNALYKAQKNDENQNVLNGDVLLDDVTNSYINARDKLVSAVGVKDLIIVETKDAVLVTHQNKAQDVKKIVEKLKKRQRSEVDVHSKIYRPWGHYETMDISDRFQVKRLTINPGAKLSLQKHYHRAEHWTVVAGSAIITNGDKEMLLNEDQSTYIPLGVIHRIKNPGKIPLEIIEVQSGSYLGEDDIVRYDDVYGRGEADV
ncbi:MAG: mannose-1-phosphate guanylyltransferase/mannose-6-phosphate isomerase [Desulfobacteraceae bacterium]|nr:mannose-1-phosphate guanylyltransferase/mannose-6-phosphate isomerase [Desulfobacteraceae bacterium]